MGKQLYVKSLTLSKEAQSSRHQFLKITTEGRRNNQYESFTKGFLILQSMQNLQYFVNYKGISSCVLPSF